MKSWYFLLHLDAGQNGCWSLLDSDICIWLTIYQVKNPLHITTGSIHVQTWFNNVIPKIEDRASTPTFHHSYYPENRRSPYDVKSHHFIPLSTLPLSVMFLFSPSTSLIRLFQHNSDEEDKQHFLGRWEVKGVRKRNKVIYSCLRWCRFYGNFNKSIVTKVWLKSGFWYLIGV